MLKSLLLMRLDMLGSWITGATRKTGKQSRGKLIAFAALMIYALLALGFLFWHIFDTLAAPFHQLGVDWLYFSMAAVMAFGLMFVGSVFTAKAQLFEAHDNDLLMSLPIRPGYILLSRLFMLFVIDFVLDLLVAVPAGMVAAREGLCSGIGAVWFALLFLLLPLFALAVGALFGWLLSLITARVGKKSLVTTVLSFAFLGAYMYCSISLNKLLTSVAADPDGAARALGAVAPVYWIGLASAEGDGAAFLGAAAAIVASFALMYAILSATFIKTATTRRGDGRKKAAAGAVSVKSARAALFDRELSRLLNCPAYMINAGLGSVMGVAAAVMLVLKGGIILQLVEEVPVMKELLSPILLAALCAMSSMMLYTTPSVSLEGKSLWIARSIPVDCRDVLRAKLKLHNLFSLPPVLLCEAAAIYIVRPRGLMLALLLVLPALFCVFVGLLGLAENLRHPCLDWISETQAVKSGIGVLFTMFIAWGVLAIPVVLVLAAGVPAAAVAAVFTAVIAVSCAVLYRLLMGWGVKTYMSL